MNEREMKIFQFPASIYIHPMSVHNVESHVSEEEKVKKKKKTSKG